MGLQLNLNYSDLLQLVQQLTVEELQQLKKDVNIAIKANQKIPHLLQYLIDYFKDVEKALTTNELNALLYLIDFGHYALHEESITGFTYQKSNSAPYPIPMEIEDILKPLYNNAVFRYREPNGIDFVLQVEKSPSFGSLYLTKQERDTIKKTLVYFENKEDFDFAEEVHYHYSWISTDDGEVIGYEKAKHCTFEWLDYYQDDDKEAYLEAKETRELLSKSDEINDLFKQIQKL